MFNELHARQLLVNTLQSIKQFMEVQDWINVNLQDRIQVLEDRLLVLEEEYKKLLDLLKKLENVSNSN